MGKQITAFLKGKIGNLVMYERMGQQVVRTQKQRVKQSAPTKTCSRNLGVASGAGKALREQLVPVLPFPKSLQMQTTFCGALIHWIGRNDPAGLPPCNPVPFVKGFSFMPPALQKDGKWSWRLHNPYLIG